MVEYKAGYLAKSLAGHDKGKLYLIFSINKGVLFLVDGDIRKLDRPKKKKMKHVQIICKEHTVEDLTDVEIRKILKGERDSKQ